MNKLIEIIKKWLNEIQKRPNPSPVPEPPVNRNWSIREIARWSAPRKVMCVQRAGDTLIISTYDGKSRNRSWLDMYDQIGLRRIYSGDDETLGPIGEWNGEAWFCAENGRRILSVASDGRVTQRARIPHNANFNIYGTIWRGRPVFAAVGKRTDTAKIYDAETGGLITSLPLKGLVAGLCVDGDGMLWAAHSWGDAGISNSAGRYIKTVKASAIAWSTTLDMVVGTMDGGKLYKFSRSTFPSSPLVEVYDADCSKINRLRAWGPLVYFSGANPDVFGWMPKGDGSAEIIWRFSDEKKDKTGEQFDTDIFPVSAYRVILARRSPSGCVVYEATL